MNECFETQTLRECTLLQMKLWLYAQQKDKEKKVFSFL